MIHRGQLLGKLSIAPASIAQELGLLGRIAQPPYLIEPFRCSGLQSTNAIALILIIFERSF
ncbi:MAG: hypothetical protein HC852_10655 [Acaryochloridaceae cyanobacterium RU_4_10]|nr:hypothetical protein [Acaryochloridaceae cyanobacterium RU_4_10]